MSVRHAGAGAGAGAPGIGAPAVRARAVRARATRARGATALAGAHARAQRNKDLATRKPHNMNTLQLQRLHRNQNPLLHVATGARSIVRHWNLRRKTKQTSYLKQFPWKN